MSSFQFFLQCLGAFSGRIWALAFQAVLLIPFQPLPSLPCTPSASGALFSCRLIPRHCYTHWSALIPQPCFVTLFYESFTCQSTVTESFIKPDTVSWQELNYSHGLCETPSLSPAASEGESERVLVWAKGTCRLWKKLLQEWKMTQCEDRSQQVVDPLVLPR